MMYGIHSDAAVAWVWVNMSMSVSVSVNVSFSFVAFICVPKCPRSFFFLLCFVSHRKKCCCQCSTSTSIQRTRNLFLYSARTHTICQIRYLICWVKEYVAACLMKLKSTHTNYMLIASMYIVQWYDLHGVVVVGISLPSHLFTYTRTKPCNVNYLCYSYSICWA